MRIVAGLTDCDGAGLALRGGGGVEADEGVCLIAGIDLQLGLPGCQQGGQRVGGLIVRKLQVVAACALGCVQEQWCGGCTTPEYVKFSKQPVQTSHLDQIGSPCRTQFSTQHSQLSLFLALRCRLEQCTMLK